jgi:hypothetical protein
MASIINTTSIADHLLYIGVMSGPSLYIKRDLKITDVQLEVLMGILLHLE